MSKQQTALKQFIEHIATFDYIKGEWYVDVENGDIITSFVNFHLELEKEQIENAFVAGDERGTNEIPFNAEQYYSQTFE